MPPLPFTTEGVDDMTMAEYLKSVRTLSEDDVNKITQERSTFDVDAVDAFEAQSHHAEYGVSHH